MISCFQRTATTQTSFGIRLNSAIFCKTCHRSDCSFSVRLADSFVSTQQTFDLAADPSAHSAAADSCIVTQLLTTRTKTRRTLEGKALANRHQVNRKSRNFKSAILLTRYFAALEVASTARCTEQTHCRCTVHSKLCPDSRPLRAVTQLSV